MVQAVCMNWPKNVTPMLRHFVDAKCVWRTVARVLLLPALERNRIWNTFTKVCRWPCNRSARLQGGSGFIFW